MSRFIISILLFLTVNLLTAKVLLHVGEKNSPQSQPQEQTWTQWAMADFEKQKAHSTPTIILGSSLVLTPTNLADANFSNATVNLALHHRSDLLHSLLIAQNETRAANFNFSLPGLMPSDAYLITKALLSNNNEEHKLIVYGVGPRDFVDNLLASPASTDPYHCLSKYLNEPNDHEVQQSFIGKNWQSQLDYFIGQHLFLFGQKEMLLTMLSKQWQPMVSSIRTTIFSNESSNRFTVADLHNLLPDYDPMSIGVNQCLFTPNPKIDPERFKRDFNEYRMRYGKMNWDTFTCQSKFFLDLLKTARSRNINVLVLAMPITSINRQLLPDYVFAAYKQNLSVLTKTYGATLVDLDSSGKFNDDDFGDTVHLSTTGSIKLMHSIAESIIQYKLLDVSKTDRKRLADAGWKI